MANVIIPNAGRRETAMYIAKKYGINTKDPAMRDAAEVAAARTEEAVKAASTKRHRTGRGCGGTKARAGAESAAHSGSLDTSAGGE